MFALRRASEFMLRFPARVASPLKLTTSASLLLAELVPFPITKAVFSVLNCEALLVTVEPNKLYSPITKEPLSLAVVLYPIAVETSPLAAVDAPIAVEISPLAVLLFDCIPLPLVLLKYQVAVFV